MTEKGKGVAEDLGIGILQDGRGAVLGGSGSGGSCPNWFQFGRVVTANIRVALTGKRLSPPCSAAKCFIELISIQLNLCELSFCGAECKTKLTRIHMNCNYFGFVVSWSNELI